MSLANWAIVSSVPVSASAYNSDTILTMVQKMNPGVKFDTWHYCSTAGTGNTDLIAVLSESKENYGFHRESVLKIGQPVRKLFSNEIPVSSGLSVIEVLEPMALNYYHTT